MKNTANTQDITPVSSMAAMGHPSTHPTATESRQHKLWVDRLRLLRSNNWTETGIAFGSVLIFISVKVNINPVNTIESLAPLQVYITK